MPGQERAAHEGVSQEEVRRDCLNDLKSAAAVLAAAVAAVLAAAEQAAGRRLPQELVSACSTSVDALLGALVWQYHCCQLHSSDCSSGMTLLPSLYYRATLLQVLHVHRCSVWIVAETELPPFASTAGLALLQIRHFRCLAASPVAGMQEAWETVQVRGWCCINSPASLN